MLVTWKYQARDTVVQRFNPRARLIFSGCLMLAIILFWDLRVLAGFFALALAQFLLARIGFRETRRFWGFLLALLFYLGLIALVTGRGAAGVAEGEHVVARLPELRVGGIAWQPVITAEQIAFTLAQSLRILTLGLLAIVLPYTIDPALYGITFRRLGLPDKLAFATDLAFRFVPSLANDFAMTVDAQKARGYELERVRGGVIGRARRLAPLLVPVTISAIANGEEVIDAMDLRAFGTRPRTWYEELIETRADRLLVVVGIAILLGAVAVRLLGYGGLWVPRWLWSG
jgi:energy-coupling factor transport system permease protein